jgi:hypothetical protein
MWTKSIDWLGATTSAISGNWAEGHIERTTGCVTGAAA